jgi:phage repressor protein C with HTH and peptisase S24 domain
VAARIQAKAAALRSRVRQVAGAPRVEPARIAGTVPRILADAAAVRAAPQVDLSAAAGIGRDIWDEPCESWVPLPDDVPDGRYISVRVAGDSMTPLMHTGDTILVKVGDQIARDSIVLAKVPDAGYVVKRVGRVTPSRLELLSLNAAFPPIDVRRDERTVVGTVVLRWCSHGG